MDISELVDRSKDGDESSFNELIKLFRVKAYGLAYSFLKNHHDAEDVSQEAFIKVYQKLKTFDHSGSFESWLLTIVANMSRNKIRWKTVRGRLTISLDQDFKDENAEDSAPFQVAEPNERNNPAKEADRTWESKRISEALAKLTDQQRIIIELKFIQGYKISEIAGLLKLAEGTVKTHIFRGLESLKKSIKEEK
jgi:RNA polymerase sigma-70 factor, ECF subfamily